MGLNDDQIQALLAAQLAPKQRKSTPSSKKPTTAAEWIRQKYPISEQTGPLRRYDREMICMNNGGTCRSPTYLKVEGKPLCISHALDALNSLVVEMTEWRENMLRQNGVVDKDVQERLAI